MKAMAYAVLTADRQAPNWIRALEKEPLSFTTAGVGMPFDFTLKPFCGTAEEYYSVYFDFFASGEWEARKAAYEAEKQRQQAIEANHGRTAGRIFGCRIIDAAKK